eukprot:scaffold11135_cov30-Prasinocladus_malaysianus.AAC.2
MFQVSNVPFLAVLVPKKIERSFPLYGLTRRHSSLLETMGTYARIPLQCVSLLSVFHPECPAAGTYFTTISCST